MLCVAVGTMALIVVLSVFNGLEGLIKSLYSTFDPEIKVFAVQGKSFTVNEALIQKIQQTEGVAYVTQVIEDNALLRYQDKQLVVKIKGVSESFKHQNEIDSMIVDGNFMLKKGVKEFAVIGRGIQNRLNINIQNRIYPLQLWYPRISRNASLNPETAFNRDVIMPEGVFAIEKQYDDHYIFVPLDFARRLLEYTDKITTIEVKAKSKDEIHNVQERLKKLLGDQFNVQNADEQHASLIKAVKVEKLFVYLTFSLILAVASINIFFSLSMLVIDKQKDIAVLRALGASPSFIKKLFLTEGAIIAFSGAILGLVLGFLICFAQEQFGFVSMGMETAVVDAYPVHMQISDFIFTSILIITVTVLVSVAPANRASHTDVKSHI
jgi:lipoprotein-releasing system permease protein